MAKRLFGPRTPVIVADDPRVTEGLAEIDRWCAWFVGAHELRLSRADEFPDRHLVDVERTKIHAQADAMASRMREDLLTRIKP